MEKFLVFLLMTTCFLQSDCIYNKPIASIEKKESLQSQEKSCDCFEEREELECRCFGNKLLQVPDNLNRSLTRLIVINSDMAVFKQDSLDPYRTNLKDVTLEMLPFLVCIEDGAFADIPNLNALYISQAPQLKQLSGLLQGVTSIHFYSLRIMKTGLEEVPQLYHIHPSNTIKMLDLDSNRIRKLPPNSVKIRAEQVTINYNEITSVEDFAFNGSEIGKLNIRDNPHLRYLAPNAFKGLKSLRELDLSRTAIESLPSEGLHELEALRIQETPSLKTIPSIYDLPNLQNAKLTHQFHCCAFKYPEQHNPGRHAEYQVKIRKACKEASRGRSKRGLAEDWGPPEESPTIQIGYENMAEQSSTVWSPSFIHPGNGSLEWAHGVVRGETIGRVKGRVLEEDHDSESGFFHQKSAEISEHSLVAFCGNLSQRQRSVDCKPEPNALNPCEDIMGFSWLRIAVWFVVILAVVGNLAVIVVVAFSGSELTVSKFLICNLAFADFCMGLYLMLIACMDLHSVGTYFNFAYDWQYGLGCQMAGFLTVFASHLSIFTLTVVTIERWVAITYAIHLSRRIRIGAATKTMLAGWLYSIFIAALPLFGVSNYSSTSICLPMEVNRTVDKAYLYMIILINGVAFVLIVLCYEQIYFSLGYETRRSSTKGEMTIAKKMALLIFTDFATWAPIAFFGITALAGYPLIGVTKSKILLVFFYPLNACANPYLYALMTAQYRKDFFLLLARCGLCRNTARQYTITTSIPMSNNSHPVPLITRINGQCASERGQDVNDAYV